jgi:hypothetical protein
MWKIYPLLKPLENDPSSLIRVVDEDGEDYLYPRDWFRPIEVPAGIRTLLEAGGSNLAAAGARRTAVRGPR